MRSLLDRLGRIASLAGPGIATGTLAFGRLSQRASAHQRRKISSIVNHCTAGL